MDRIKKRVTDYWTGRSADFARLREQELEGEMARMWLAEIESEFSEAPERPEVQECQEAPEQLRRSECSEISKVQGQRSLRVLDVGTGSGFFAVLLAEQGHRVTGIDLTPAMIEEAEKLKKSRGAEADFLVMDAEALAFEDGLFDAVVSRNLTWTLPHPEQAYREWLRVLKPGGVLLNFDADYGKERFSQTDTLPAHHAHRQISCSQLSECDAIKDALSISTRRRPVWDIQELKSLGCARVEIDTEVSGRIYRQESPLYNPTPLFRIRAVKAG